MDLRVLRYFLAVAREESMTRAAQILHVTQPTLSRQLKVLEEELGKTLFIRHAFRIELTENDGVCGTVSSGAELELVCVLAIPGPD